MKYEDLIESKQFLVSVSAYGRTYAVRVDDIREFMQGKVVVDLKLLVTVLDCADAAEFNDKDDKSAIAEMYQLIRHFKAQQSESSEVGNE